jgi:exosortase/archaeosortase family protein
VLAGYFFLRSPISRVVLAVAVVPIALLRNGFRIFTIGELCVHISPDMIHSYIHTHGGPLFFALSLVPFFALLVGLIRLERKRLGPPAPALG